MYNVGMYNGCIKILCNLYLKHIKINQSYVKCIMYILSTFKLYFRYIWSMSRPYYMCIQGLCLLKLLFLCCYYYHC
jgi:hypothetical protein